MNIEQQVCTLEQAKKISSLLTNKQEALFYWTDIAVIEKGTLIAQIMDLGVSGILEKDPTRQISYNRDEMMGTAKECFDELLGVEIYPAYTVAELGELLKEYCNTHQHADRQMPWFYNDSMVQWWTSQYSGTFDTEAQARAAMLIYLLENNLHTLPQ